MPFEVKILGSCSATPVFNRHPSAQLLNIDHRFYLIDCGEATQLQLNRYKVKFNKIDHIFISHLHGDHYLGLVGLISSMHLHGRTKDLDLYGPPGLDEIITVQMRYSETFLHYKIHFHELDTEKRQIIYETNALTVETIPLQHRVKCCGFLFREKPK
ncbi:MAG: MBL fold metallo-hydrolase, partial [Cytophagaceae bacterium]